jgi:hypothetical protein
MSDVCSMRTFSEAVMINCYMAQRDGKGNGRTDTMMNKRCDELN